MSGIKTLLTGALCALALAGQAVAQSAPATPPPQADWQAMGLNVGFPPPPDKRMTRENTLVFPNTAWGYQHMRELYPTRAVARAGPVSPLPERKQDISALEVKLPDGRVVPWADYERLTYTDAQIVLHRGRIVSETYANGMKPESAHLMFSMTKSFVGLIAELLIAEGKLDETAKVTRYVPELEGSAWAPATVRDVLDMRDGVTFNENYADPTADIHIYARSWGWGPLAPNAPRGVFEALPALKARFAEPGGPFIYRSAATDALGWVVVRAANQSLASLVSERIWKPLGVEHDGSWALDLAGQEIAAAGLNMTARDLARFGEMLRNDGRWNSRQIVPAAVVAKIRAGGDRAAYAAGRPSSSRTGWSYHSQFWISHDANGSFNLIGVAGQRVYIDPKNEIVIVRFGTQPELSNSRMQAMHDAAYAAVTARLTARR
jgi:CubicO group peptidase (beta-lactamase class C family)